LLRALCASAFKLCPAMFARNLKKSSKFIPSQKRNTQIVNLTLYTLHLI
jgi:hypothetical protein